MSYIIEVIRNQSNPTMYITSFNELAFHPNWEQDGDFTGPTEIAFLNPGEFIVISRDALRELADLFPSNPIEIYTNAGVELHSTERGQYRNITVTKVSLP